MEVRPLLLLFHEAALGHGERHDLPLVFLDAVEALAKHVKHQLSLSIVRKSFRRADVTST